MKVSVFQPTSPAEVWLRRGNWAHRLIALLLAIPVRMWLSPEDCQIRLPRFTSLATIHFACHDSLRLPRFTSLATVFATAHTTPGFRAPTVKAPVREFVATVVGRLDLPACLPFLDSFLKRPRATCCFAEHAAPFKLGQRGLNCGNSGACSRSI